MLTQYMEGGQLFDMLKRKKFLPENIAAKIIRQILYAVNYCHIKKIMHRDLKPENILLDTRDSYDIKLIDFELSTSFQNNKKLRD